MTELTAKEFLGKLRREDLSAEQYQELFRAITARRLQLRARLESIESRNGAALRSAVDSGDPEQLAALNREAESIDDEIGFLSHAESRAIQLRQRAQEREATAAAQRAHDRIASLIKAAAEALAKYETARQELGDAISAIGSANATRGPDERLLADEATVERVIAAMWPNSMVGDQQRAGVRSGIRRQLCAPPATNYGQPPPDLREQARSNMFSRRT